MPRTTLTENRKRMHNEVITERTLVGYETQSDGRKIPIYKVIARVDYKAMARNAKCLRSNVPKQYWPRGSTVVKRGGRGCW